MKCDIDKYINMEHIHIYKEHYMAELILEVQKLPETIFSRITTEKVSVYEKNGTITLTPIFNEKPKFDHLIGIFSDGKISIDDFLNEKLNEKQLEL